MLEGPEMNTTDAATDVDPRNLAFAYRRLVLWFGVQLLLFVGSFGLHLFSADSALGAIVAIAITGGSLVTALALCYYGFRTSGALRSKVPWLWGVVMLVPYLNVVSLLLLSSKANKACRAQGIPVGLLGPRVATTSEGAGAG